MTDTQSNIGSQVPVELIFKHNPLSVALADPQRRLLRVNRKFTELYGYTEEECLGKTTAFLYAHPQDYGETGETRYNLDAPLQPDAYAIEYRRKDGTTFIGETVGVQLRDEDGRLRGYVGVTRDLTEQVEFEADRRRILEELERSRAFLAETERIARIGGGELDLATDKLTWSAGMQRLYGLPEGITPSFEEALAHFEPEGQQMLREAFERAASEGSSFDMELPFHVGSEHLWVRAAASPVYEDGEVTRVRGFVQDITAQKQAERAKSEFIAMVSHELRNPLSGLLSALHLIENHRADLPEEFDPLVSMALRNGQRLGTLINDILDTEKLEAGQLNVELDLVAVDELVGDIVESNRGYAARRGVALRVDRNLPSAEFCVDAGRLEQVVTNLITNAIKFSEPGQTVEVGTTTAQAGWIRIEITDHGPGISEDFQEELFEKFTQEDLSDRCRQGTGLGLYIARRLTEQMNGRIGLESTPGEGATFYVEFPEAGASA